MPELAEIKHMSDFLQTKMVGQHFDYVYQPYPEITSGKSVDLLLTLATKFNCFDVQSRGKELKLSFFDEDLNKSYLLMGMGMTGNWGVCSEQQMLEDKHIRIGFVRDHDYAVYFTDFRKFGKWKFVGRDEWGKNRGYCPVSEHGQFWTELSKEWMKEKPCSAFAKKPAYETLLDQKYFNGIGNYLRAEILGLIVDQNITLPLSQWSPEAFAKLVILCKDIPLRFYEGSGGVISSYRNPNGDNGKITSFRFYNNPKNAVPIKDRNKRTFWISRYHLEVYNLEHLIQ